MQTPRPAPASLSALTLVAACALSLGGCAPGSAYNESSAQDRFFDEIAK